MKSKLIQVYIAIALLLAISAQLTNALAQGTAFTYQGRLSGASGPANGTYDLTFKLWNASSGGSQIGSTITTAGQAITNGLFVATLDFGGVFNGSPYWVELAVRTNGAASYTTLAPRQSVTPTPYAITAENVDGLVPAGQLTGTVPNASLPADVALLDAASQTFTGVNNFSGNISLLDPTKSITFPATAGANAPMMQMFASGTGNADRMVIAHSPFFQNWGLQYQDFPDRFNFLGNGFPVMSVNLGFPGVGIGITNPSAMLEVNGTATIDGMLTAQSTTVNGMLTVSDGSGAQYFTDVVIGPGGYDAGEQHSINFDDFSGHIGSLSVGWDGANGYFNVGNLYNNGTHYTNTTLFTVNGVGDVIIDPMNYNSGSLNNGTNNGAGITFGSGSGEGIASQRTPGLNQWGLDFYTDFAHRMSILNSGLVGIGTTNPAAQLDVESAANIGIQGATASTVGSAYAVYGLVSSTSPGGFSTALRGQNNGTGGSGIGVWGSQNGSGWGGYFTSASGIGVLVSGGTGTGISVSGGTGISVSGTGSALTIAGGALHVTGASTNSSTTTAFTQVATASNIVGDSTKIDNTFCNGDPNAILIVTPNYNPHSGPGVLWNKTVGVWYNGSNWLIFNEDISAMPAGPAFNVLVIKN